MKDHKIEKEKQPEHDKQQEDPSVQRGKEAIEASKKADPAPENIQKKKDKQDAEKWRNEG